MTTLARKRRVQVPVSNSVDLVMTLVSTDRPLTHGVACGEEGKRRERHPEALMPRVFSPQHTRAHKGPD